MEINVAKNFTNPISSMPSAVDQLVTVQSAARVKAEPVVSISASKTENQQESKLTDRDKQPSEQELQDVTEHLNAFMRAIDTNVKFVLHAKTNQLIIQVEDTRTHKTLKECPARELLDMVARIKDYVGGLVDKNA